MNNTDIIRPKYNNIMISRRAFFIAGTLAAVDAATPSRFLLAASRRRFGSLPASLAQLEKDNNGRLGVAVLDIGSGESSGHRTGERFAMCSTFKMLLAAAVLERVDAGKESLARRISIPATGLLPHSPATQEHAGASMPILDLCAAIVMLSDNTAANLLLASIDGPAGITRFARSLGDNVTRLDRIEIALNEALPGDPRDTTSPAAMVANMRKLLLGNKLSAASREQLTAWLIANKTGDERLRAGLTSGWRVGDKTGSNGENTTNDIAITWPPRQAPVLVAAYLTACEGSEAKRNAVLAQVGRLVASSVENTQV
jgi:beta-lactamase class A